MLTINSIMSVVFRTMSGKVAIHDSFSSYSYSELESRVNHYKSQITESNLAPNTLILVEGDRDFELISKILASAILGYPHLYLPKKSEGDWFESSLSRVGATFRFKDHSKNINIGTYASWGRFANTFVNFSSGTTGKPKIIPVPESGVINLCYDPDWIDTRNIIILSQAAMTFDIFQLEVWVSLLNGGTLVLHNGRFVTPNVINKSVSEHKVNTMFIATTLFHRLHDTLKYDFNGIKYLMVGGEALLSRVVSSLFDVNKSVTILNGYGPTESTIGTSFYEIPRELTTENKVVPLGKPIRNVLMEIPDKDENGVGEVYISGPCLTEGYINEHLLNDSKFIIEKISGIERRWYRTGDLMKVENGLFCYLGRVDLQVKIRGNRVDPQELTYAISDITKENEIAIVSVSIDGQSVLVLVHGPNVSTKLVNDSLKDFCLTRPDYMHPSHVYCFDVWPVLSSGKTDIKSLQSISASAVLEEMVY
ncbi:AMP-binding protein [Vibrio sp. Isolate31]|uniref:AMP-binding protein n=1 Tax=unclassified Vibrio TaxID=2614977 RepID=UPI001EFD97EF|nr:AMP-binding protein [Vibrio sp. Isolate32]MCG9603305.1 AMP-binding protein [Vibrio sp. Isolate31]